MMHSKIALKPKHNVYEFKQLMWIIVNKITLTNRNKPIITNSNLMRKYTKGYHIKMKNYCLNEDDLHLAFSVVQKFDLFFIGQK